MPKIILRQGSVTAKLSEVFYQASEGFLADNTWCVSDECITADSDVKLTSGPAMIQCGAKEFAVTVTVFEFEHEEDEDIGEGEPACNIEIGHGESLPKLALALGLLEHLTPKQQQAIMDK